MVKPVESDWQKRSRRLHGVTENAYVQPMQELAMPSSCTSARTSEFRGVKS